MIIINFQHQSIHKIIFGVSKTLKFGNSIFKNPFSTHNKLMDLALKD